MWQLTKHGSVYRCYLSCHSPPCSSGNTTYHLHGNGRRCGGSSGLLVKQAEAFTQQLVTFTRWPLTDSVRGFAVKTTSSAITPQELLTISLSAEDSLYNAAPWAKPDFDTTAHHAGCRVWNDCHCCLFMEHGHTDGRGQEKQGSTQKWLVLYCSHRDTKENLWRMNNSKPCCSRFCLWQRLRSSSFYLIPLFIHGNSQSRGSAHIFFHHYFVCVTWRNAAPLSWNSVLPVRAEEVLSWARPEGRKGQYMQETDNSSRVVKFNTHQTSTEIHAVYTSTLNKEDKAFRWCEWWCTVGFVFLHKSAWRCVINFESRLNCGLRCHSEHRQHSRCLFFIRVSISIGGNLRK